MFNYIPRLGVLAGLLFLVACETPSLKEIQTKTDLSMIDSSTCATDMSGLPYVDFTALEFDIKTTVKVNDESNCLMLPDQPTYIAGYVLPEFGEKGYGLQIESRVIKTQLVFIPDVYLLDSDYSVISKTTGDNFKYRQIKFEKTVFVNSNEQEPKYVIFTTDPGTVGESESRRLTKVVTSGNGAGGYWVTGSDKVKEIFYTTQGEISVTPLKN